MIKKMKGLLAALLLLSAAASRAAVVEPVPARVVQPVGAFLASPTPDWRTIKDAEKFVRGLDPRDSAALEAARPLIDKLQAAAQILIDVPPGPRTTDIELRAAAEKLSLLNNPAFRNLLTPEQQSRVPAVTWAYREHMIADFRQERWTASALTLTERIEGIARALEAAKVARGGQDDAPPRWEKGSVSVEILDADVATVEADAMACAVQPSGYCHGGINALLDKRGDDKIKAQLEKAQPLKDGQTLVARGAGDALKFKDVVFFVDDARLPLHQQLLNALKTADEAGFKTVSLPAARTGYNLGLVEKTYEEVVAETVKGVNAFIAAGARSLRKISIVAHKNPRLLSLLRSVAPPDPERERLRTAKLSGAGYSLTPRAKTLSRRRLRSVITQDLLEPWSLARMLRRRRPERVGTLEDRASFSKPSISVLNLPIKMPGTDFRVPAELEQYREFLQKIIDDEAAINPRLSDFYAYLTVDSGFVKKGDYHRRPGIHIDGVQGSRYPEKMPPENTYTASDAVGTVFYAQPFDLRHIDPDRDYIHGELERQADERNAVAAQDYGIYHWDSYSAHRAAVADDDTRRTFLRVEFSRKKYDSVGDSINPLFDYDWPRVSRPIPYELNWHAEPLAKVVHEKGRRANSLELEFVEGTSPAIAKAIRKSVTIRSAADAAAAARTLSKEPTVATIRISNKIPPLWDLVVDYPALDGRTAFPELGRPLDDGAVVEGSKKGGGNQADFLIDLKDPDLKKAVLEPARRIGASKADDWAKLGELQALVNAAMPRDGWRAAGDDPEYHAFVAAHSGDSATSLADYVRLGIGVCRENALLTVLALRAAGYKARFAYFKVFKDDGVVDQDHAVALVELGGTTYVLDSYRPLGRYYNGHRLVDLLQPPADGKYPEASPLTTANTSGPGRWRFVLNPFPRVKAWGKP